MSQKIHTYLVSLVLALGICVTAIPYSVAQEAQPDVGVSADVSADVSAAPAVPKKVTPKEAVVSGSEIKDVREAVTTAKSLKKLSSDGNWGLFIAGILALLVFGIRIFWDFIPTKYLPWAVAGVALLLSVIDGLNAGEGAVEIIIGALETSTMAGGLWGLAKPFFGKMVKSKRAGESTA